MFNKFNAPANRMTSSSLGDRFKPHPHQSFAKPNTALAPRNPFGGRRSSDSTPHSRTAPIANVHDEAETLRATGLKPRTASNSHVPVRTKPKLAELQNRTRMRAGGQTVNSPILRTNPFSGEARNHHVPSSSSYANSNRKALLFSSQPRGVTASTSMTLRSHDLSASLRSRPGTRPNPYPNASWPSPMSRNFGYAAAHGRSGLSSVRPIPSLFSPTRATPNWKALLSMPRKDTSRDAPGSTIWEAREMAREERKEEGSAKATAQLMPVNFGPLIEYAEPGTWKEREERREKYIKDQRARDISRMAEQLEKVRRDTEEAKERAKEAEDKWYQESLEVW